VKYLGLPHTNISDRQFRCHYLKTKFCEMIVMRVLECTMFWELCVFFFFLSGESNTILEKPVFLGPLD